MGRVRYTVVIRHADGAETLHGLFNDRARAIELQDRILRELARQAIVLPCTPYVRVIRPDTSARAIVAKIVREA